MYFTVKTAFVNYFDDLIDSLDVPILQNGTTHEQISLISLQSFDFVADSLKKLNMLKEFVHQYQDKKRNFWFA